MAKLNALNLARGVSRANLVALCTNSYAEMAILATLWRIRMPTGEFGCPVANSYADWRMWLP